MVSSSGSSAFPATALNRVSASLNPIFRKGILVATQNRLVSQVVRRYGMRLGAARFVAGETLDEAVVNLRALNQRGLLTNTTLLGEGVKDEAAALAVVDAYTEILDRIAAEGLQTNIALKLTHLGLGLGEDFAYQNVERLVAHAATLNNFIRIDMEDSPLVDVTLRIYRRLREAGHDNVGTVLQSYLYRTARDLEDLLPLKPNLRLVKGAYLESPDVAYPDKADVDRNYIQLAERMLDECSFAAIATQDDKIINHVIDYTRRNGIGNDRFEFQMLYGIRRDLQQKIVDDGWNLRIYVPFGEAWYPYLMRRMAERPANLFFIVDAVVRESPLRFLVGKRR